MKITTGTIPIYRQIIDYFELEIASGRLKSGQKIDSIRSLAVQFKVNPNTVQKSLLELERAGYIYTDRTNGKFVTDDEQTIKKLNHSIIKTLSKDFVDGVRRLGFDYETVVEHLKEIWEEENE